MSVPPPAPNAVPLMDMNYVIRQKHTEMGIAAFYLRTDAIGFLKHLQSSYKDHPDLFEIVNNTTGVVYLPSL